MVETSSHQVFAAAVARRSMFGLVGARVPLRGQPFGAVRTSTALIALAAVLVVTIVAVTVAILWHFRNKALDDAERQIRNLNRVLAEQTARSVEHVDFILRSLVERIQSERAAGGGDDPALQGRMHALIADTPQIRTMIVVDAEGRVTQSSTGQKVYVGDRPHFMAQRDGTTAEPYISKPFVTRLDEKVAVSLSRRLQTPGGAFAGMVATSLDPGYFNDLYRSIELGNASTIALFRSDGVCLIQYPDGPTAEDVPFAHGPGVPFLAGALSGLYRDRDPRNDAERFVSFHRVANLPLVSVVSVTTDTILKDWRREVRLFSAGAVVVAAVLCLLLFLLATEVRRRDALGEALRVNEERFRNFAEASSDWFWEQDADLRFTYLSNAVFSKSGLAVADHIGKTRQEVVHRGVTAEQWRHHQADLDARRPFRDFRFQRVALDGSVRHISISGTPVFDDGGRFSGYSGNARDITDQIVAEQSLREAKAEAEGASRTKGEFLAVISHELRTPLNAIIGFSDVISREILGPIGTVKYREYAGDILTAGRHLLGLINNILDMSKIEARKMELAEEVVELDQLAEGCIKILGPQAAVGGVRLSLDLAADLPRLRADAMRLKQIVLNLLSNAVKFTPAGGRVTLSARRAAAGAIEIAVADTGIGMNDSEIDLALQPFRQIESAMARKHEGTGLGLPLVKAFTELHGGAFELSSVHGEGTVARVTLPASRVAAMTASADGPGERATASDRSDVAVRG
jgi:PAS domain S-box-containing protein